MSRIVRCARIAGIVALLAVGGCAAGYMAIAKRNLDVQTRLTDTVFLEPMPPQDRTIFVEVKNTSDRPDLYVEDAVKASIASRGYQIVDDPDRAHIWLQANVRQAGKSSETAVESAYNSGFGGILVGGGVGGAVGYGIGSAGGGNDTLLTVGGALAGAAIEGIAGAFVQDVTYSIITDLMISERAEGGIVSQSETGELAQGASTRITQATSGTTDMRRYQTRIISSANKVNLAWEEAAPQLVSGLTRSISGIF